MCCTGLFCHQIWLQRLFKIPESWNQHSYWHSETFQQLFLNGNINFLFTVFVQVFADFRRTHAVHSDCCSVYVWQYWCWQWVIILSDDLRILATHLKLSNLFFFVQKKSWYSVVHVIVKSWKLFTKWLFFSHIVFKILDTLFLGWDDFSNIHWKFL